ncbi:MAG: bile acid:sodium symporter family protein [Bacteroidia bacterium]
MFEIIGENIHFLLNSVLGLIMFGLGMSLKRSDFQELFHQPKALSIGLFSQMILLPMMAVVWVMFSGLSPEFKIGVLILSICPGGITSNLVSYFVKGNVALSVSLTVINSLLTLFSIPILVNIFLNYFDVSNDGLVHLPVLDTMFSIFNITILPASVGMFLRDRLGKKILQIQKYINIVLPVLLFIVFGIKFLGSNQNGGTGISINEIIKLTPIVIGLNVSAMLLGVVVATIFNLSFKNRVTIAVEVGLHNTALALIVAGEKLGITAMEKPALVYAMYSFFITYGISILLVRVRLYRLKKRA